MDAADRRTAILERMEGATTPLPAARLGEELGVSRQIIVGDVALLRASGHSIHATNRGYLLARPTTRPRRSLLVQHTRGQIPAELSAILDAGGPSSTSPSSTASTARSPPTCSFATAPTSRPSSPAWSPPPPSPS